MAKKNYSPRATPPPSDNPFAALSGLRSNLPPAPNNLAEQQEGTGGAAGETSTTDALRVHLDRRNPVFEALAETDRALFSVVRDVAFVPSAWNRRPETEAQWAAPTVYFAAVQLIGRASVIDDPAELGEVIARLVARLQPEVEIASIVPGPTPFGRMLGAVRGVRLDVEEVRVRIKAGGDKAVEHRLRIADALAERGAEADLGARAHLLRRLGTER